MTGTSPDGFPPSDVTGKGRDVPPLRKGPPCWGAAQGGRVKDPSLVSCL